MLPTDTSDSLKQLEENFSGTLERGVPRAKYAYYRIGGPAFLIASPRSMLDLSLLHTFIRANGLPHFFMGWGSNLLFSDAEFPGVVIRMKHLFATCEETIVENGEAVLKLGASLGAAQLLKLAAEKGYGGLAKLTGIPGSVGGMVAMNAGTHLGEIGSSLVKSETIGFSADHLQVKTRVHRSQDFSYRRNHFLAPAEILLHTYFRKEEAEPVQVAREIKTLYERRKATQPVEYPSCGSVFMNPKAHNLHAWQVIEKLGLKGHRIGNAQFSEKHANFIVNLGNANASDVKNLIELAKEKALTELGILLHEEVKYIL